MFPEKAIFVTPRDSRQTRKASNRSCLPPRASVFAL
jgi:hypothetical protein